MTNNVACNSCGNVLDDDICGNPDKRKPCPKCGSVARNVSLHRPGHLVTADDVRALMGVLQGDGASKGFLTTTSDFAPKIKEDPLIVPFIPSRLELINGEILLKRLIELRESSQTIFE